MVAADVAPAPPELATSARSRLAGALAPAGVYLAVRVVGVAVLAWLSTRKGITLTDALTSWDGQWLLAIARSGYAGVPAGLVDAFGNRTPFSSLGFFPGYPALVGTVGVGTGGNVVAAGLLVSGVAGVVAAYGLAQLGELVAGGSRRAGLLLVGLFAAEPMAVVLSMTYTEALFCALVVWALVGVLRRDWLLAGACTGAAGLVRPSASALLLAVGLAAAAAVLARRDGWRPWAGGLLAAIGLAGYLGYVAVRTGEPAGWYQLQREGWGWHLDGGVDTARFAGAVLTAGGEPFDLAVVVALLASIVLFVLAVRLRLPWPLLVYAAATLVTAWGSAGLTHSKIRLLVPAFVLLLPVAIGLSRRRTGTAVAVVAAAALGSAWFGAYALTIWPYAI